MALVSPSVLRSKYALAALLALVAVSLATFGYFRWADAPFGGFGSGSGSADATGIADAGDGLTGIDVVDDALAALLGRSPGERTVGISGKGKGPARAYRYARSPAAQALEEAFSSPLGASRVIEDRPPLAPSLILPDDIFGGDALPGLGDAFAPAGGSGFGPGGGVFFPGGGFPVGGGGGPGDGGGTPPPGDGGGVIPPVTPPPVVPAIPEPGTWLMMLLGMAAVGAALRSGKTAAGNRAEQPILR